MKHYIYDIDNDFKHFVVVAPNQQEAKKVVKEISGSAMCNMTVNSREVAPQEYQRMGKFVKVLDVKHGTYTAEPEQATAETMQNAEPEPEHLEETVAEPEQEKAESEAPEQATAETAQDAEPKNTNDKSHTALQEGLNHTRVFYKGEWRVLVLFLPIKCGLDFADRCEIKALPERNYEDIATSLENSKHGFSEWYLYDPETNCKRLKRYQDTAMKKFTAKTGVQVLEAELNHPERKAVVYGHDKDGKPIQSGLIPVQKLGETLTDYNSKCVDSDFFIYDHDTGKYDVSGEHPPKRFMKMFPELGGAVA